MPIQPSPPYLPTASIWPRQLNRWLDINAQNGSLRRTQTYITLPAFSEGVTWLGFSDIIAAFNFEGPNNFSLTSIPIIQNPNYLLCIMWIDKNQIVHRYALWNNVGEVMYIPYPLYTGQLIGKNFRFEIWSLQNQTASQALPIVFYTSKLGIQDYRHGNDVPLVIADNIITNFSVQGTGGGGGTLPTDIGLLFQIDPLHNLIQNLGEIVSWTSFVDNTTQLVPFGTNIFVESDGPQGGNSVVIQNDSNYLYTPGATLNWGVKCMILTCMITGPAQSVLFSAYPTGLSIFWNNGTISTGGSGPSVSGLALNIWYTFICYLNGNQATLSVYNTLTGALVATQTALAPVLGYSSAVVLGNANCNVVEAILGSNTLSGTDITEIISYMQGKYYTSNEFPLPLVWPAGAVPQGNTI